MAFEDLDPIDIAIIRALNDDARTPMVQIASMIGAPESTIRNRLNKLVEDDVIEFAVLTNPHRYSPVCAHFEIRTETARAEEVAERIAECREIYFVSLTMGRYDIMASGFFQANEDVMDFKTKGLGSISGITEVEMCLMAKVVKRVISFDVVGSGLVARDGGAAQEPAPATTRKRKSGRAAKAEAVGRT